MLSEEIEEYLSMRNVDHSVEWTLLERALADIKANEWVSVEDRFPEKKDLSKRGQVHILKENGDEVIAWLQKGYFMTGYMKHIATHWKPITKPEAGE